MALSERAQRSWDALLTGVPFGIYKVSTGYYFWTYQNPVAGLLLIAWGIMDLATNLVAACWQRALPYCFLSALGRLLDRQQSWKHGRRNENVSLALDTLLSAILVSGMIGFRLIPQLGPYRGLWEWATICQVVGVGLSRLLHATRHQHR
jgi:hypothetical protein